MPLAEQVGRLDTRETDFPIKKHLEKYFKIIISTRHYIKKMTQEIWQTKVKVLYFAYQLYTNNLKHKALSVNRPHFRDLHSFNSSSFPIR